MPGEDPAAAYQVLGSRRGTALPGVFVVGWARRASDGVVGRARLDAETGIKHVVAYLAARREAAARGGRAGGRGAAPHARRAAAPPS